MASLKLAVPLIPLILLFCACEAEQKLSTKECENLGFTGLALCSDCHTFAEYIKDQELVSDCLKCCAEDSDDATSKVIYSGAILEVCMRKLVFYPELVGFIEEDKDKFPSVKVQYAFNSPPKLIMLDDDGQLKETISSGYLTGLTPKTCFPGCASKKGSYDAINMFYGIDNWKREHILQFLKEKVKPSSDI